MMGIKVSGAPGILHALTAIAGDDHAPLVMGQAAAETRFIPRRRVTRAL